MRLVLLFGALALGLAGAARGQSDGSELKFALIVSRHGIDASPSDRTLGKYAAQPWPSWSVAPGELTRHGAELMAGMGAYYRELYVAQGLLTGRAGEDAARIYFRADSDQRTMETARRLAEGLLPGQTPAVHALELHQTDPLFRPNLVLPARPDFALARAAVLGRIGGDPAALLAAHRADYDLLQRILFPGGTVPSGKVSLFAAPPAVGPKLSSHIVSLGGPLRQGMALTDAMLTAYVEGKPMSEVGWGRLSRADLGRLLELHALYYELTQRTFYPAQVQGSNLASHILRTLEQAAENRPVDGALGGVNHRLVVVVGHDTNLHNLGGLLGLSWLLPGTAMNPALHGGALVFELRARRATGQAFVRVSYVAQTLEQQRGAQRPTRADPPGLAPIFIPGCSVSTADFEAPLALFAARVKAAVDPRFVAPDLSD